LDANKILLSKNFFRRARSIVHRHDPIGLKPCPSDEYDPELASIIRRLRKCNGLKSAETMVHGEFVHWFGPRLAGSSARYQKLAQELLNLYKAFLKR